MFRSVIKSAFAGAISWTRLNRVARVPFVAFYHRVVERLDASNGLALPAMEISVTMLERHLDWLGRHFRIVSPDDLGRKLEEPAGSVPLAAVTFDDGYADVFHHAFPMLKRKGIPAGIFVVTDLVGSTQLPMHERLHALLAGASRKATTSNVTKLLVEANVEPPARERARRVPPDPFSLTRFLLAHLCQADVQRVIDHLERGNQIEEALQNELRPLSWEMLAEMRDAGMTIGSHSKSHPFLTNESKAVAIEEAADSRRKLLQRLGGDAACFAYPSGDFNSGVVDAVRAAGYRYAFTTCDDRDPRYPLLTIPRTGLWERSCLDPFGRFSPAIMSCQASGTFRWVSRCTQRHSSLSSRAPQRVRDPHRMRDAGPTIQGIPRRLRGSE